MRSSRRVYVKLNLSSSCDKKTNKIHLVLVDIISRSPTVYNRDSREHLVQQGPEIQGQNRYIQGIPGQRFLVSRGMAIFEGIALLLFCLQNCSDLSLLEMTSGQKIHLAGAHHAVCTTLSWPCTERQLNEFFGDWCNMY